MYKETAKCRICGNEKLDVIFELGEQHLTGVFPPVEEDFDVKGPVTLVKCTGNNVCGLVQLKQSYDLDLMYGSSYGYRSGLNASMVKHLEGKIAKIENSISLVDGDVVIDIGANDGTSLKAYTNKNVERVGVDPTITKFSKYYPSDIIQIADFFPCQEINTFLGGRKCKVITSFSMFYDLEDPVAFAKTIAAYLDNEGIWVFEQSYLPSMLQTNSFDTICHEHIEFYSLKQIDWILDAAGLMIIDTELNDVNGGSISVTAAHKNYNPLPEKMKNVEALRKLELERSIDGLEIWSSFSNCVEKEKNRIHEIIFKIKSKGGKVYGLGASTKGNVLLQYYELTGNDITAVFEVNPDKFGCKTPGSEIPIIDEQLLGSIVKSEDVLLVLPWHFKEFFLSSDKFKNLSLLFPLPLATIVKT